MEDFPAKWLETKIVKLEKGIENQWVNPTTFNIDKYSKEIIICAICESIVWNCKQCTKCEENFCLKCLQNKQSDKIEKPKECPLCQKEDSVNLEYHSRQLQNILKDIKFICPFIKRGCFEKQIKYQDFEKHINSCFYRKNHATTKYQKIDIINQRKEENEHIPNSYFINFQIKTTISDEHFKVYRRYSEFDDLYNYLKNKYQGSAICELPQKTGFYQNLGHLQMKDRKQSLQMFLEIITQNKLFEDDSVILNFTQDEKYIPQMNGGVLEGVTQKMQVLSNTVKKGASLAMGYLYSWTNNSQEQEQQQIQQSQIDKKQSQDDNQENLDEIPIDFRQSVMKIKNNKDQFLKLNKNLERITEYIEIYEKIFNYVNENYNELNNILKSEKIRQKKYRLQDRYLEKHKNYINNMVMKQQQQDQGGDSSDEEQLKNDQKRMNDMPYPNDLPSSDEEEEQEENEKNLDIQNEEGIQIIDDDNNNNNDKKQNKDGSEQNLEFIDLLDDLEVKQIQVYKSQREQNRILLLGVKKAYLRLKSSQTCIQWIEQSQEKQDDLKKQKQNQNLQQEQIQMLQAQLEEEVKNMQIIKKSADKDCQSILNRINLEHEGILDQYIEFVKLVAKQIPEKI